MELLDGEMEHTMDPKMDEMDLQVGVGFYAIQIRLVI